MFRYKLYHCHFLVSSLADLSGSPQEGLTTMLLSHVQVILPNIRSLFRLHLQAGTTYVAPGLRDPTHRCRGPPHGFYPDAFRTGRVYSRYDCKLRWRVSVGAHPSLVTGQKNGMAGNPNVRADILMHRVTGPR